MFVWKLWLDDQLNDPETPNRWTPSGYIGAKSSQEALEFCESGGMPTHMNLDHDLGKEDTVRIFLRELAEMFPTGPIPSYEVHSANPLAKDWVDSFMNSWKKSLE